MDNLVAEEAMGRSLFRKRAFEEIEFEEVNKAEDEETSTRSEELLGTMEGNQAEAFVADREQLKEKLFPQINWDALRLDFDDEEWAALQASLAQNIERERNKTCEADLKETARKMKELEKRKAEEWEAMKKVDPKEIEREYLASTSDPGKYRDDWNAIWSRSYGSFEDTTKIPAMRFTHKPEPEIGVNAHNTLQVFSAKVASTSGGLQWPIDVFGLIAIRDTIDNNRNIIFNRTRESCQMLTEEDHSLVLVGPKQSCFCVRSASCDH